MKTALIASGAGRYADPWHPFGRTSPLVAEALRAVGFNARIDDDVDHAMTALKGIDLLVVNAGDPWRADAIGPAAPSASVDGFAAALQRGIGVLALHCAVASLRDYPEWSPAIGAMWVPGASMHPELGAMTVSGGVLAGDVVETFDLVDERYCRLQRLGRSSVVATHAGNGVAEPAAWVREAGASRIAVDVLGHDERSFKSAGHRRMLGQLALWAVG